MLCGSVSLVNFVILIDVLLLPNSVLAILLEIQLNSKMHLIIIFCFSQLQKNSYHKQNIINPWQSI